MVDQTFLMFIQIFVVGAVFVFMGFGLATLVLMIHLTSLPERRRAPRPEEIPATSFAD